MKKKSRIVFYGICIWAIPFLLGMLAFPLNQSAPALFDTVMAVGLTVAATLFASLYVRRHSTLSGRAALATGFGWMLICLLIDFPILVVGLGMGWKSYISDVGATYLIVPIVLYGIAYTHQYGAQNVRRKLY